MNWRIVIVGIWALLASGCQPPKTDRIEGYRVIYRPPLAGDSVEKSDQPGTGDTETVETAANQTEISEPHIRIALTNTSIDTLKIQSVKVIGLPEIASSTGAQAQRLEVFPPGQVWLLPVKVKFACRIPVHVIVEYHVDDPKDPKDTTLLEEKISLPRQPTALSIASLEKCACSGSRSELACEPANDAK